MNCNISYAKSVIYDMPTADVAPVKHGKWIYRDDIIDRCSVCANDVDHWRTGETKYCPNCGAKMDKEE